MHSNLASLPEANGTADVAASWARIEELTTALRTAASDEAWERVVELAARRHQLLLAHFAEFPVGPDNAGFYQQTLTAMAAGEQALQALAVDARRQIMRQSVTARHNHRAVGAYLTPSR